jgi:hypothetical protein
MENKKFISNHRKEYSFLYEECCGRTYVYSEWKKFAPRVKQGCHKGRFWRKIPVWTSAHVRVYLVDGFLPSGKNRDRADASPSPSPPPSPSLPSAIRADAKK